MKCSQRLDDNSTHLLTHLSLLVPAMHLGRKEVDVSLTFRSGSKLAGLQLAPGGASGVVMARKGVPWVRPGAHAAVRRAVR